MEESSIDKQLSKARDHAEGYGQKYGAKETADDYLKTEYARLYEFVPEDAKTVGEKDAWIKRNPAYLKAVERKKDAYAEWKTAETFMKILLVQAEVWRTECANSRLMDKAHR